MKLKCLLFCILFIVSAAENLLAADTDHFGEDNLILSIYNNSDSDNEVGIDLGSLGDIDFTATNVTLAASGSFSLSKFVSADWPDLQAGVFSSVGSSYEYYFGLSSTDNPGFNTAGMTSIEANADYISGAYQSNQTSSGIAVIGSGSSGNAALNTYDLRMNSNGTSPAYYGGANASSSDLAEAKLNALENDDGYVDIYLFYFSLVLSVSDSQTNSAVYPDEDYYAVIRLKADGSVLLNPPAATGPTAIISAISGTVDENNIPANILDGSPSTEGDASIAGYLWEQTDSSGYSATISDNDAASTTFTVDVDEDVTLTFSLTVTDENGKTDTTTVDVSVKFVNEAPTASAGEDRSVVITSSGQMVTLSGSVSDPDSGDTVTSLWTCQEDAGFSFTDATDPATTFNTDQADTTGSASTTLTFLLTATDTGGTTGTDTVAITFSNPPEANASASAETATENNSIDLSGSASTDKNGDIASYKWACSNSGAIISSDNASETAVTLPEVSFGGEELTFTLTVTDSLGNTDTDTVTVTVQNANNDPSLDEISVNSSVAENSSFSVDLTDADNDGVSDLASLSWELSDSAGNTIDSGTETSFSSTLQLSFTAPSVDYTGDELSLAISVTDKAGSEASKTFTITVTDNNNAPAAVITCTDGNCPDSFDAGTALTFTGEDSSDEDGYEDIATYSWELVCTDDSATVYSSGTSSEPDISYNAPATPGNYRIILTVTDRSGDEDSVSFDFTISSENYNAPVAAIADIGTIFERMSVSLDGSESTDEEGFDDITGWEWTWKKTDENDDISFTISDADTMTASFTAPETDDDVTITISLKVTDSSGLTNTVSKDLVIRNNHVPAQPSVSSPAYSSDAGTYGPDNGEVTSLTPTLIVNNGSDTDVENGYQDELIYSFRVSTSKGMTNIVAETDSVAETSGTTTSWTVTTSLSDETVYYWQASSTDGCSLDSEISWTDPVAFFVNTANDAPGTPVIQGPLSGAVLTTQAPVIVFSNASDSDYDTLTYDIEIYTDENGSAGTLVVSATDSSSIPEGNVVYTDDGNAASDPEMGQTSWKFGTSLPDNTKYILRINARDVNTGESSLTGTCAERPFSINLENDLPATPEVVSPANGSETESRTPTLIVSNSEDPDTDETLAYYFEVTLNDDDCDFEDDESCDIFSSSAIEEGEDGTTSWSIPSDYPGLPLKDNTEYKWRARVKDSSDAYSEWQSSRFFVNLQNDAPVTPELLTPADGTVVSSSQPTLTSAEATDADYDTLTYWFEVHTTATPGDKTEPYLEGSSDSPEWQVTEPLTKNTSYYWRVRVSDNDVENELYSAWTEVSSFRYFENFPPQPSVNSPQTNGTVSSLTPVLSIVDQGGLDDYDLDYQFEIYADRSLSVFVAYDTISRTGFLTKCVLSSDTITWSTSYPNEQLIDGSKYYWRVRATNGTDKSSWSGTAHFTVDTESEAEELETEAAALFESGTSEDLTITVTDPDSPIYGTTLTIPAGSLDSDEIITVGYVSNPKAMPDEVAACYAVLSLGPSGTEFSEDVTITIPWDPSTLADGLLDSVSSIRIYWENEETDEWEVLYEIAIADITGDTISFTVSHFSNYTIGVKDESSQSADDAGNSEDNDGGSGGSGCFINVLKF